MKPELIKNIELIHLEQKNNHDFDWKSSLNHLDQQMLDRLDEELNGWGPIKSILALEGVTEVLANNFDQIYFEKNGTLNFSSDHFYSKKTYIACLDRLAQSCQTYLCREKPFVEAQIGNLRITVIYSEISRGVPVLSIRVQPPEKWTLEKLNKHSFTTENQFEFIQIILKNKFNFLVVGPTGSGKTSFLQALLEALPANERAVIIEDTQELHLPNPTCVSLLSRQDPAQTVPDVSLDDLLKRALRLRPDRLIVGEVRGPEAKSLLLSLSSGHNGSFGSLHARSAHEALLRLEMLIQMGAPQWNLNSIRKLILMTLDYIIVLEKNKGLRKIKGVYKINSLEETGFTLSRADDEDSND